MEGLGLLIALIGLVVSLIGSIGVLIVAFQEDLFWGLGTLLIPFVGLIFVCTHWRQAGGAFMLSMMGSAVSIGGSVLAGV